MSIIFLKSEDIPPINELLDQDQIDFTGLPDTQHRNARKRLYEEVTDLLLAPELVAGGIVRHQPSGYRTAYDQIIAYGLTVLEKLNNEGVTTRQSEGRGRVHDKGVMGDARGWIETTKRAIKRVQDDMSLLNDPIFRLALALVASD